MSNPPSPSPPGAAPVSPAPVSPAEDWQRFWQEAGIDGCTALLPPAVALAIAQGWQALLAGTAPDLRLLDVACGRGAIMAAARAAGLRTVSGVDLAVIPGADPAIRGGVDAAQLPFPDASHDIVASQFGIEYAGLMTAGLEAARVARRQLWLLLHADEGPIARQAREQMDQIAWLRAETHGFAQLGQPDPGLDALRARIVTRAQTAENTSLLEGVWHALGGLMAGGAADAATNRLAQDLDAYAARLGMMTAAAPTAAATQALGAALAARGWQVTIRDEGDGPVARWLIARR
jgi:hypothetical protein